MSWKKKRLTNLSLYKKKNYSFSRKLIKDGRIIPEFEVMLSSLSLEEVIGLKLELAAKSAGGMLYGLPLWRSLPSIIKDAVIKFAISSTKTKLEAARVLGINKVHLFKIIKQYEVEDYFEEKEKNLTKGN